jgi:hypothetical protein
MAAAPAAADMPPATPSQDAVDAHPYTLAVLRLLIHNSKAGLLIGKGGAGIRTISDATGAKLYIHDLPPGCTERVVRSLGCHSCLRCQAAGSAGLLFGLACAGSSEQFTTATRFTMRREFPCSARRTRASGGSGF